MVAAAAFAFCHIMPSCYVSLDAGRVALTSSRRSAVAAALLGFGKAACAEETSPKRLSENPNRRPTIQKAGKVEPNPDWPPRPAKNSEIRKIQKQDWENEPNVRTSIYVQELLSRVMPGVLPERRYAVRWLDDKNHFDVLKARELALADKLGKVSLNNDLSDPNWGFKCYTYNSTADPAWARQTFDEFDEIIVDGEFKAKLDLIASRKFDDP